MTLDPWTELMGNATAAWAEKCAPALVDINRQWLEFINGRLAKDAALMERLSDCKTPEEVWQAYAEFWQGAAQDYQAEFAELARLGNAALEESVPDAGTPEAEPGRASEEPSEEQRAA